MQNGRNERTGSTAVVKEKQSDSAFSEDYKGDKIFAYIRWDFVDSAGCRKYKLYKNFAGGD